MRTFVDDILASGVYATIAAEVAHRTSIMPVVLGGIGHAVMPSAWAPTARQAGATIHRIVPERYLHVTAVSRHDDSDPRFPQNPHASAWATARSLFSVTEVP